MVISKNTVDTYRRRLLAKTGTYNATELINYCIKKEIIQFIKPAKDTLHLCFRTNQCFALFFLSL